MSCTTSVVEGFADSIKTCVTHSHRKNHRGCTLPWAVGSSESKSEPGIVWRSKSSGSSRELGYYFPVLGVMETQRQVLGFDLDDTA